MMDEKKETWPILGICQGFELFGIYYSGDKFILSEERIYA